MSSKKNTSKSQTVTMEHLRSQAKLWQEQGKAQQLDKVGALTTQDYQDALDTEVKFGKYKGQTYGQVAGSDFSYFKWSVEKTKMQEFQPKLYKCLLFILKQD